MLSKKNRVPRRLFSIIITEGKNYSSLNIHMRVVFLYKEEKGHSVSSLALPTLPAQAGQASGGQDKAESRFSFVVSKKEVKKAVERNKLRRIGYNIIQKNISNINKGYIIAFFLKKRTLTLSKRALEEEIISLLQKANLLKTRKFYD